MGQVQDVLVAIAPIVDTAGVAADDHIDKALGSPSQSTSRTRRAHGGYHHVTANLDSSVPRGHKCEKRIL